GLQNNLAFNTSAISSGLSAGNAVYGMQNNLGSGGAGGAGGMAITANGISVTPGE
ncbi:collagen, type XVII, alpha 1a isoform X1, partial [Tachysurus ichikawai]